MKWLELANTLLPIVKNVVIIVFFVCLFFASIEEEYGEYSFVLPSEVHITNQNFYDSIPIRHTDYDSDPIEFKLVK